MRRPRRTVYIVRHGLTRWNEEHRIVGHTDLGLSERGRAQAAGTARILAGCPIDLALSSPLRRTRETAEIALAGHDLSIEVEPRLTEIPLAGWEGKSREELRDDPSWRAWLERPHEAETPEGARLADVQGRAVAALRDGLARVEDRRGLAIFTHGGVARLLTLHILGMPLASYHRIRCDCSSVQAFDLTPEGELYRVLALNVTDPLQALTRRGL